MSGRHYMFKPTILVYGLVCDKYVEAELEFWNGLQHIYDEASLHALLYSPSDSPFLSFFLLPAPLPIVSS
jgi:hypothetical protein